MVIVDAPLNKASHLVELEPMEKAKKYIEELIEKASKAEKSEDAMRFAQAACNAGNAVAVLENLAKKK